MAATLNDLTGDEKIITIDEIKGRFATRTQRQDYYEREDEQQEQQEFVRDPLYDPNRETTAEDYSDEWEDEEHDSAVTPERAMRTGARIASMIDFGFNFAMSNFVAHTDKEYRANPKDLDDIAQAWGEIAGEKQWEFSPGVHLMILYLIVYAPLAKEAFNDRRFSDISTRQDSQAEQIKALQNELARIKESAKKQE